MIPHIFSQRYRFNFSVQCLNRGGKNGRLPVICRTPITRSLVLCALITGEFVKHHLAFAESSLFNTISAPEITDRGSETELHGHVDNLASL